eukprot:TRINITY_DN32148_c0_g1_i1.p1 TRINITY_DN32148_c0_g1~~TRINITY_DN32148_c0_g1_i1.p1  ORF type:complete len:598 (-),score=131.41 TRINITY_DN32148_c0_g1_i1:523-2316(-)
MPPSRRWGSQHGAVATESVSAQQQLQQPTQQQKQNGYPQQMKSVSRQKQQQQPPSFSGMKIPGLSPEHEAKQARHGLEHGHPKGNSRILLEPGFRVARLDSGQEGFVEFVPSSNEALVHFGDNNEDLNSLAWIPPKAIRVVDATCRRSTERSDVRTYRESVQSIKLSQRGVPSAEIASKIGRPESWVQQKISLGHVSKVPKPKGMEWWDPEGFCEVTYLRGYAKQPGLYEEIVQGVDWEQDKVWRVRKQEGSDDWHLRTVKECPGHRGRGFCGKSLQKVPDTTHQIGPQDVRRAKSTRPHADWSCDRHAALVREMANNEGGAVSNCQKVRREDPFIEPYWWCPHCQWYACDACAKKMPDKATSKQVAHWRPGSCAKLDELIADLIQDFHLPDPLQHRYTVKMNWYPDGLARVSPHRHDNWTLLVSLGAPRVLTVDRANVLMEDGDLILFGTQSHGVPEMMSSAGPAGGRLSLVLMFAPSEAVGMAATARARAGGNSALRAGAAPPELAELEAERTRQGNQSLSGQHQWEDDWVDDDIDLAAMSLDGNPVLNGAVDDDDESVQALCSMGFDLRRVKVALATVGKANVQEAAALLLAAA